MGNEPQVDNRELQRISQELGEAKAKLTEERSRREQELNRRLDKLDDGQTELLRQFAEVKDKKVGLERFLDLERRVDVNSRMIYIGFGVALALQIALPFLWARLFH